MGRANGRPPCGTPREPSNRRPGRSAHYAGPQAAGAPGSFYGLDQVNVVLPHYLAGAGVISLTVTALAGYSSNGVGEGADSNTVYVDIQ